MILFFKGSSLDFEFSDTIGVTCVEINQFPVNPRISLEKAGKKTNSAKYFEFLYSIGVRCGKIEQNLIRVVLNYGWQNPQPKTLMT